MGFWREEFPRVEISRVRVGRILHSGIGRVWSGIFTRKWDQSFHPIHKEALEAGRAHTASLPSPVLPHNTWVAAGHFLRGSQIWTGAWYSLSQ